MPLLLGVEVVLYIISVFLGSYSDAFCPNPRALHPCTCLKSRSVLSCEDLDNEEVLKSVASATRNFGIVGVELVSVAIRFIPEDAFEGLNIKYLIIKNSSILALSDTNRAFSGIEKSFLALEVSECPYANAWEWKHLAHLTSLVRLEIVDSELLELGPDFLSLSHLPLVNLKFSGTSLETVPENAFSSFKDVYTLSLDRNYLNSVQRSMFPMPAKKLESLSLSNNHIGFLPQDIFIGMPVLKYLYIGANRLYTMDEKTFKPVWKHISMFLFHDSHLVCDCRLSWFPKMNNENKFIHATCANPVRLKGRKIITLEKDELWCTALSEDLETDVNNKRK